MKRLMGVIIVASVAALLSVASADAQTASPEQGFVVSPPTFDLTADRGDVVTRTIRVDNLTDKPLALGIDKRNFSAIGNEGQVGLTTGDNPFALAPWITVNPSTTIVPAKSSQNFSITVNIPRDAEAGGRFGSVVFRTLPKQTTGQTITVGEEIGSLILLKIKGETKQAAHITSFERGAYLRDHGPVTFTTIIHNDGNVHVTPSGTITIKNAVGKVVTTLPVDPLNILPAADRKFTTIWSQKRLAGKYTATLSVNYGNGKPLTAATTLVALPFKLLLIGLAVIILLVILIVRGRRRIGRALLILSGKE